MSAAGVASAALTSASTLLARPWLRRNPSQPRAASAIGWANSVAPGLYRRSHLAGGGGPTGAAERSTGRRRAGVYKAAAAPNWSRHDSAFAQEWTGGRAISRIVIGVRALPHSCPTADIP